MLRIPPLRPPRFDRDDAATLAAAGLGALAFALLGVPAGSLSGSMVGGALLLAGGGKVRLAAPLRDAGMLLSGVTMGSAVTPAMLRGFGAYPVSILLFVCSLAVTIAATGAFFRKVGGWDKATAFFAAAPGALSSVLAVAADTRADLLKITMAQSFRLFVLVALLPAIVVKSGTPVVAAARGVADAPSLASMLAGGAAVALVLGRFGFAGPWIFGGMLVSAVLHATSLVEGELPAPLQQAGFALVGAFIATRFSQITRRLLVSTLAISFGAFLVSLATAASFAYAAALATGVPFGQALVAFAPGGLEAMIVLGAALGLDPIYVGLHHLVRFFGIGLSVPLSLRWLDRR